MKKKFSLQNKEVAEAAVKDAPNFGLSASIEEQEGDISVAYDCASPSPKDSSAVCWDDVYSIMRSVASEYEYQIKYLREDMKYATEAFYKHLNGHIPAIKDSGMMKKALKTLGLEDSYEVRRPQVYVEY